MADFKWNDYNNDHWQYEEIHKFGPAWSIVKTCNNKGIEQVFVFHAPCRPSVKGFIDAWAGKPDTEDNYIGGLQTTNRCDKCGVRPPHGKRYLKMFQLLYPDGLFGDTI